MARPIPVPPPVTSATLPSNAGSMRPQIRAAPAGVLLDARRHDPSAGIANRMACGEPGGAGYEEDGGGYDGKDGAESGSTCRRRAEMQQAFGLTDHDLRFIADVVGGDAGDPAEAPAVLRAREDLLDVMLEDDRLVERLLGEENVLLRVSPRFVFTVLLRRVVRDLRNQPYTLERTPAETIAVFDAPHVRRFIAEPAMWDYLVRLLTSFLRNEAVTVFVRAHGRVVRRRFSTSSLEDMMRFADLVDHGEAPWLFRRIADIALFQSGVFPDSLRWARAPRWPRWRRNFPRRESRWRCSRIDTCGGRGCRGSRRPAREPRGHTPSGLSRGSGEPNPAWVTRRIAVRSTFIASAVRPACVYSAMAMSRAESARTRSPRVA